MVLIICDNYENNLELNTLQSWHDFQSLGRMTLKV